MESLALLVFVIWCCVWLCGPLAILFHHLHMPILAMFTAALSIWLGIFWFVHVYTWFRLLGLLSVLCGLYVLWQTAQKI